MTYAHYSKITFIYQIVMKKKYSNYYTALLVVLREQLEVYPHQSMVLDALSLSKSELDKILNGDVYLNIHQLFNIIHKLGFNDLIQVTNNFCSNLHYHGFCFQNGNINKDDDELLSLHKSFYSHKDFINRFRSLKLYYCIGSNSSTFFYYCTNDKFRNAFNEECIDDFLNWNVYHR